LALLRKIVLIEQFDWINESDSIVVGILICVIYCAVADIFVIKFSYFLAVCSSNFIGRNLVLDVKSLQIKVEQHVQLQDVINLSGKELLL
jgi:hypothetical protein